MIVVRSQLMWQILTAYAGGLASLKMSHSLDAAHSAARNVLCYRVFTRQQEESLAQRSSIPS
jgi:hypothetical protein